jgi:3-hydroxyisobutyrate dehydrogenase
MSITTQTIGFAGLGRMGQPMAGRLAHAGFNVRGYDVAGTENRLEAGVVGVESIEDLAAASDVIFLSVPSGAESEEICRRIAETPNRATTAVVDLSTIGIAAARRCSELLAPCDIAYVDAPVSGGVAGAVNGSLAMMVSAPQDQFDRLKPALDVLASKCFRVGDDPGQGQAMKLVNNYASAAALAATCEAAVFGEQAGLDLATIIEVVTASSGRSAAIEDKFPKSILPGTYDFGFAGALMTKDVNLYLECAEDAGVPHDLASATAAVWRQFLEANPNADFTYIHKHFKDSIDAKKGTSS